PPFPGTATFQATFRSGPHSRGSVVALDVPWPVGPRNSGQSLSSARRVSEAERSARTSAMAQETAEADTERIGIQAGGDDVGPKPPHCTRSPSDRIMRRRGIRGGTRILGREFEESSVFPLDRLPACD